MKKKVISLVLAVSLLLTVALFTSCTLTDLSTGMTGGFTQADLDAAVAKALAGKTYNYGDSYDITITGDGSASPLAASKALLSAVSVYATFDISYGSGTFPWNSSVKQQTQAGAGVIYKLDKDAGDAYIITNYHVVYNVSASPLVSEKISLFLYGQEMTQYAIPATYVGGSMQYDIAVLRVQSSDILKYSNARAADIADSDEVSVLETAIAIGNPESGGLSATLGHINVDSEYITMTAADERTSLEMRLMRIDTAVNSGNSGGGLFNDRGELIGIVNAKVNSTNVDNIGYAIPSNVARAVADNILYYNDTHVYRCLLGIKVQAVASRTEYDTETGKVHIRETVAVQELTSGSFVTGILETGDILTSIEIGGVNYEIHRMYNVVDAMLNARAGDTVVIHYERAGVAASATVTIPEGAKTAA